MCLSLILRLYSHQSTSPHPALLTSDQKSLVSSLSVQDHWGGTPSLETRPQNLWLTRGSDDLESDPQHGLSLKTLGVCLCLFRSGKFGFNTIMFQTFTYMSLSMSICMCVCSSTCLHRCMFMSRTHNTHMHAHIHAHTTHTPHHSEFSTRLFFHQYQMANTRLAT